MNRSEILTAPRGTRRKAVAIAIASAVFASGAAFADAGGSIVNGINASVLPGSYGAIAQGLFAQVADGTGGVAVQDDFRGAASVNIGALNTIEVGSESFDGAANTIVGQVNYTKNANGALVYGAGNSVTNSYAPVVVEGDIEIDLSNPSELTQKLQKAVGESGGKVLAIGGANTADFATNSQLVGVGNTLKGKEGDTSDYNLVNGVGNALDGVDHVTVIGSGNKLTTVTNAIVLGDGSTIAKRNNVISIGNGNTVNGDSAVLVGEGATAGLKAIAIGSGATASMSGTNGQVAIGDSSAAKGDGAVAIGQNASTDFTASDAAVAVGKNSKANGRNAVAIGSGAKAAKVSGSSTEDGYETTAVGYGSSATGHSAAAFGSGATASGYAGTALGSGASASGFGGTAAGNGAQASGQGSAALGSSSSASAQYSVAIGSGASASANSAFAAGTGAVSNGQSSIAIGANANNPGGYNQTVTAGAFSIAMGSRTQATGQRAVTLGYGARASKVDSVALGAYSVAEGDAVNTKSVKINGTTYEFAGVSGTNSRLGVVSVGGKTSSYQGSDKQIPDVTTIYRQIQNVAAGRISATSTDAVNGSQFYAATQAIEAIQKQVTEATANSTDTHVKAGDYAVSGEGKVELKLADKSGNEIEGQTVTITDVAKASEVGSVSSLNDGLKNESGSTTIVEAVNKVDTRVGDQKYSEVTGTEISDGDSVTDAIGKLNNRAAAAVTEAGKHTTLTEGANVRIEGTETNGQKNYKVSLADDISVKTVKADSGTIGGVTLEDGAVSATSASIGGVTVADGKVTAGTTVISSDAVTAGDSSLKSGSLTVNGKEYIGSDGISANGQKITNVAAGTSATDAVNYGQLQATQAQVDQNSADIGNLYRKAGDLSKKINRTGANAAALAALHPLDYDEDHKVSASVGIGQYHGTGALAVGVFIRPTENLMLNLGGSFANSDKMFNAGLSYRFGDNGAAYGTKAGMAQQVSALTAENKDLTGKLESANTKLESANAKIDKVTAENAELRAEIEKIKAALKLK